MRILSFLLLVIISIGLLGGCSSSGSQKDTRLLVPLPPNPIDPSDEVLKVAVQGYLKAAGAPVSSRYDLKRYDLNNDGRREGIVFLKSPYGYWCGLHGCAVLVFKAYDTGFTLVNKVQPVRAPVYVSPDQSNGWKNLVVRVAGRTGEEARDVKLEYNGRTYPEDPSRVASVQIARVGGFGTRDGVRLFYE